MLRSVKYGLYAAVLAGVVGGSVAWTAGGEERHRSRGRAGATVHTTASDVGGVLRSAGYRPELARHRRAERRTRVVHDSQQDRLQARPAAAP